MVHQARRRDMHWAPVPVFLLEHPTHGPVLVDTGYAADSQANPKRTLGPDRAGSSRTAPTTSTRCSRGAGVQAGGHRARS